MAQVINTNIMSLNAQRNLNQTNNAMSQSIERLSSGLRINSAADDAAGLAISERFTSQIRGQNQAIRNANDGLSFAQTAEGALDEVGNMSQRIRELAVQSANDTNSQSDRQAINQEVQSLVEEVDRIAESTEFNGQKILSGALDDLQFQVGANQGQTISVDGVDSRSSSLGAATRETGGLEGGTATAVGASGSSDGVVLTDGNGNSAGLASGDSFTLEDETFTYVNAGDEDPSAGNYRSVDELVESINLKAGDTGVEAVKNDSLEVNIGEMTTGSGNQNLTINGTNFNVGGSGGDYDNVDDLADAINGSQLQTDGITANVNSNDELELTSSNGEAVQVAIQNTDATTGASFDGLAGADVDVKFEAGFELQGEAGSTISMGNTSGTPLNGSNLNVDTTTDGLTSQTLNNVSVESRANATEAIQTMDFVIGQVSSIRSELGAAQNRMESTISNLEVGTENLSAARSRIQDADFAKESSELTRNQVLQQAGTSMLAQANQLPQNALSLLQ